MTHLPYKPGSSDLNTNGEITPWGEWFDKMFHSYAAKADGYYGNDEARAVSELQRRLNLPVTGVFDERTARASGFLKAAPAHRPIWFYSAPGSGASWNVGPSFDVGNFCQDVLHINHQPVGFPIGGYLGFMGGDPSLSYNDVIAAEGAELERLIASCPDLNNPNVEFWFSGYSQSADGMEDAVQRLFGDGGRFANLRPRINGIINFGNPSRQPGPTKVGNNPAGWGISRKVRPAWMIPLIWSVTNDGDFYACTDDELRPLFYHEIVQADTQLPFFVHILKIALPVILNFVPIIGGLAGPFAPLVIAGAAGIGAFAPLLGGLMGQAAAADEEVDKKLEQMLSVQGILANFPSLIKLIGALPGIGIHGDYWAPKPEFGGRSGVQVGMDIVKDFRR